MTRRTYAPTNLRPWREHRELSLDQAVALLKELADVKLTKTSLSRIEIGKQPYSQPILEGLAIVYRTTAVALLAHNPQDPGSATTSLWEHKLDRGGVNRKPTANKASPRALKERK